MRTANVSVLGKAWKQINWSEVENKNVSTLPNANVFVLIAYRDVKENILRITRGYWNANLMNETVFTIDCLDTPGFCRHAGREVIAWMPIEKKQGRPKRKSVNN